MAKAKSAPQGDADGMSARELKLTCMANLLSTTEERVYFKDLESRFLFVSAGWIAVYAPAVRLRSSPGRRTSTSSATSTPPTRSRTSGRSFRPASPGQ
jgi:hypothetical protein